MMDDPAREKVNALYWESDASVAEIADNLGISRRALYETIDPRPAGALCPACGGDLHFRNRTAAERLRPECADCGEETTLPDAAGAATRTAPTPPSPVRSAPRSVPGISRDVPGAWVGGAMVTGLVVGAALGYLLRRH